MNLEAQRVSHVSKDAFGSLNNCLLEVDPQSEKRASRIKQRALTISIALQTLALSAVVLFPLLGKGERIAFKFATPTIPYPPTSNHRPSTNPPSRGPHTPPACHFCAPPRIPPTIPPQDPTGHGQTDDTPDGNTIPGFDPGPGITGGIRPTETHPTAPTPDRDPKKSERRSVSEPVQMAQLIHRVEPIYPALSRQIHREGRVELHALISTSGTIESLEVVTGDPLFIQSALSAVREWRYRPTILDGHPVEVDTYITVVYTLSH